MTILQNVVEGLNAKESNRFSSENFLSESKVYEFPYKDGNMYFSDDGNALYSENTKECLFFYWERYYEGMKYAVRFTATNESIGAVGIDNVLKMGNYDIKSFK